MQSWISWALLALFTWGLWGFFPKLALRTMTPESAILFEGIGAALTAGLIVLVTAPKISLAPSGVIFSSLTGVTAILGGWFYLIAAQKASISKVVILTALYPALTVLFAFLVLREPLGARQMIALALALAATIVIGWE